MQKTLAQTKPLACRARTRCLRRHCRISCTKPKMERPNRSASQRREQYGRAPARAKQLLLQNLWCLEHRGCHHTKLGYVLYHSSKGTVLLAARPALIGGLPSVQKADAAVQTDFVEELQAAQKRLEDVAV